MFDVLRSDDIERSRSASPEEKLAQALDLMATGLRLKRAALRDQLPDASEAEIQAAFEQWLFEND